MNSYRDNNNITSFINFPILISDHIHPLILCNCQRGRNFKGWVCDKCSSNYSSTIPSFYCTYCDYDLCQNCLGEYKLKEIKKYNCNLKNRITAKNNSNEVFPWQIDYPNHKHFLSHVKKMNNWFCDSCKQNFNDKNNSYYCSLCDYDICYKCSNDKSNVTNTKLFMNKKKEENKINNNNSICGKSCQVYNYNSCSYRPYNTKQCIKTTTRKPVIYLYPEKEMDISVQLIMNLDNNKYTTIYPKFNGGNNIWNIHAKPNGDILIKDKKYPYLFWEADSYFIEDMNEGFIVKDENAEKFLEEKLKILGLNYKESTDFITFWLPILMKNKLSLCQFQTEKFFNDYQLNVTPKPNTMIRIFLFIKKIDSVLDIKEQKLESNERKGFTVIEWGGRNF